MSEPQISYSAGNDLFQYHNEDPDTPGLIFLRDGQSGMTWEVTPPPMDMVSEERLSDYLAMQTNLVKACPVAWEAQHILFGDSNIQPLLDEYLQAGGYKKMKGGKASAVEMLIQEKMDRYINASRNGVYYRTSGTGKKIQGPKIKQLRFLYTLRCPTEIKVSAVFSNENNRKLAKVREQWAEVSREVEQTLEAMGCSYKRQDGEGLRNTVSKMLYPYDTPSRYNESVAIRDQILTSSPVLRSDQFEIGGYTSKVLTVLRHPASYKVNPWMQEDDKRGDAPIDFLSNFRLVLNYTTRHPDFDIVKLDNAEKKLDKKGATRSVDGISSALDVASSAIRQKGQKLHNFRIHIVVSDEDKDALNQQVSDVKSMVSQSGGQALLEETVVDGLFFQTLPLLYDRRSDASLKVSFPGTSQNIAEMSPLYGEWVGDIDNGKHPRAMFINFTRRGQVAFRNPYATQSSPHVIRLGASGSGKSMNMADEDIQFCRMDGRIWAFDKGKSKYRLCKFLDGEFVNYAMDQVKTQNIFYPMYKAKQMNMEKEEFGEFHAFLVELVKLMADGVRDDHRMSREEDDCLELWINKFIEPAWDKEPTLTDFLKSTPPESVEGSVVNSVINRFAAFSGNGKYSKYVDGLNEVNPESAYTVFEIDEITSKKDLFQVVFLNNLNTIYGVVNSPAYAGVAKRLELDECHYYTNDEVLTPRGQSALREAIKILRKRGVTMEFATQEPADMADSALGKTMKTQCPQRNFLAMAPEEWTEVNKLMEFPDNVLRRMKTAHTRKGAFADFFYGSTHGAGMMRALPDNYSYWLTSTEDADNLLVAEMEDAGMSMQAIIAKLAREKPIF